MPQNTSSKTVRTKTSKADRLTLSKFGLDLQPACGEDTSAGVASGKMSFTMRLPRLEDFDDEDQPACGGFTGAGVDAPYTGAGIATVGMQGLDASPRYTHACTHPMPEPMEAERPTLSMERSDETTLEFLQMALFDPSPASSPQISPSLIPIDHEVPEFQLPPSLSEGLSANKSLIVADQELTIKPLAGIVADHDDYKPRKRHSKKLSSGQVSTVEVVGSVVSENPHYMAAKTPIEDLGMRVGKPTGKFNKQYAKDINSGYYEERVHKSRALGDAKHTYKDRLGNKWAWDRYNRVKAIVAYVKNNCYDLLNITDEMLLEVDRLSCTARDVILHYSNAQKEEIKDTVASPGFWAFALIQEAFARQNHGWKVVQESSVVGEEMADKYAKNAADKMSWDWLSHVNEKIKKQVTNETEVKYEPENVTILNNGGHCRRVIGSHSLKGDPKKVRAKFKVLHQLLLHGGDKGLTTDIQNVIPPEVLRYEKPKPRADGVMMPCEAKRRCLENSIYSKPKNGSTSSSDLLNFSSLNEI